MREEKDIATHDTRVRSPILYGSMLCAVVTSFSFSAYSLLLPAFLQEFCLLPIGALDIPDVIRLIRSA